MAKALLPVVMIVAGFILNYVFQRGRTSLYDYSCGNCGEVFSLSALAASVAPHRLGGMKWVRCPACGTRSWAAPVSKS